ncbi:tetratricopeptide repeat protein [Marininema halotolerans]|uniref:Uncharacterized protein n=1 Tax=Marininema halotolerans TaxID=1155944 RepID=A0A1I6U293_9BACL|nr:tetratricopeptide repeat protein [Marininema halotolerans]SFS95619.1 hypothetical protein SAMN05444972_11312 [Marininema halotolerans]
MTSENAFLSAILHLKEVDHRSNIWTKSVTRSYASHNFNRIPYHLGQLLEPSVLHEVSHETGISVSQLKMVDYETQGPMREIQDRIARQSDLSPVEKLNVVYCLVSLSRYERAVDILSTLHPDQLRQEDQIYLSFIQFLIKNRLSLPYQSDFIAMREALGQKNLSDVMRLKVCTQAIVWELKQKALGEELYTWFVNEGLKTCDRLKEKEALSEQLALSSFYRAYAMIPAAKQLVKETREEMEKALYFAKAAKPSNPLESCRKLDAMKTCFESELKEHLYLSKDYEQAERAGFDLIQTDPDWSISYHELAEVYMKVNKLEEALAMFQKSKEIGLPRTTFTHFMMGYCLGELHREDEAIDAFIHTLTIDPTNLSAGINGYNLAKKIGHAQEDTFKSYLTKWEEAGILKDEHKQVLSAGV